MKNTRSHEYIQLFWFIKCHTGSNRLYGGYQKKKKKNLKHIQAQTHTREGVFDWVGVSWVPLLAVPGNVHCSETRGTGGREGGRGGGRHVARSLRLHPLSLFLFLSRLISLLLDSTQFKGTLLAWLTKINNTAGGVYITISPVLRLFMSLSLWNISTAPLPSPLNSSYIPLSLLHCLYPPFVTSLHLPPSLLILLSGRQRQK